MNPADFLRRPNPTRHPNIPTLDEKADFVDLVANEVLTVPDSTYAGSIWRASWTTGYSRAARMFPLCEAALAAPSGDRVEWVKTLFFGTMGEVLRVQFTGWNRPDWAEACESAASVSAGAVGEILTRIIEDVSDPKRYGSIPTAAQEAREALKWYDAVRQMHAMQQRQASTFGEEKIREYVQKCTIQCVRIARMKFGTFAGSPMRDDALQASINVAIRAYKEHT